jgi:chromate transport protein ChrA
LKAWAVFDSVRRWATAATIAGPVFVVVYLVLTSALVPAEPWPMGLELAVLAVALIVAALAAGRYSHASGRRDWVKVALLTIAVFVFLVWFFFNVLIYGFPGDSFPDASPRP